jgi:nucleotide-binding universal stress UspA family protein
MEDIKRILVVSRSTAYCHKAVQYGLKFSKMTGAKLYVVHIFTDPFSLQGWNLAIPLGAIQEEYRQMVRKTRQKLDRMIASQQTKENPVHVKEIVTEGSAFTEVCNLVEKENIDLVIMMAHEEGRVEKFLFDHDNQRLIRKMPCSIFLVKK